MVRLFHAAVDGERQPGLGVLHYTPSGRPLPPPDPEPIVLAEEVGRELRLTAGAPLDAAGVLARLRRRRWYGVAEADVAAVLEALTEAGEVRRKDGAYVWIWFADADRSG